MTTDYLVQLKRELSKLDSSVNCLEEHLNSTVDLHPDTRASMITDDIISVYNQKAWYLTVKEEMLDSSEDNSQETKTVFAKEIRPDEEKILERFRAMRELAYKRVVTNGNHVRIINYIQSHPVLRQYL